MLSPRAVRLEPKFDRAWYGLGLSLAAQDNHAEAVQAIERAAAAPADEPTYLVSARHGLAHACMTRTRSRVWSSTLHRFDRHMAHRLIQDTGRTDLAQYGHRPAARGLILTAWRVLASSPGDATRRRPASSPHRNASRIRPAGRSQLGCPSWSRHCPALEADQ